MIISPFYNNVSIIKHWHLNEAALFMIRLIFTGNGRLSKSFSKVLTLVVDFKVEFFYLVLRVQQFTSSNFI